jgi:hypothetical protein
MKTLAEQSRLHETKSGPPAGKRLGACLPDSQFGPVREDYSPHAAVTMQADCDEPSSTNHAGAFPLEEKTAPGVPDSNRG